MSYLFRYLFILFTLILLSGCSGGGKSQAPIAPDISDLTDISHLADNAPGNRFLLGYLEVFIDPESHSAYYVPLRGTGFHCNIIEFFTEFGCMQIDLIYENYNTGEFHLDFTMTHPLPDSVYTIFDMRGIIFGNGPGTMASKDDPDLLWLNPDGFQILNYDGLTRWWNPNEFPLQQLLGYIEAFTTPGFSTKATLHPYKYFATGLGYEDNVVPAVNELNRGAFLTTGAPVSRRYEIKFPVEDNFPVFEFSMAFDCSWDEPSGGGDVPGIDFFPLTANCGEAYYLKVDPSQSAVFYEDGGPGSGEVNLKIEVFDWGALENPDGTDSEIAEIVVESDTLFDDKVYVDIVSNPGSNPTSRVYNVSIPNVHPTGIENQNVLVGVKSSDPSSYAPPLGWVEYPENADLAAYIIVEIPVYTFDPNIFGEWGTNGTPVGVIAENNVCYVLDDVDGFQILDVSIPDQPELLYSVPIAGPVGLDYQDGYAYVIDNSNTLNVVDVYPISDAAVVHTVGLPALPVEIELFGSFAYVGDTSDNIQSIDLSDPESASISSFDTLTGLGPISDLKARGDMLYVAADNLEIFNIGSGDAAYEGMCVTAYPLTAVDVSSWCDIAETTYAFAGDANNSMLLVDVQDPSSPYIDYVCFFDNPVTDIRWNDGVIYATVATEGLKILLLDEYSAELNLVGELDLPTDPEALYVDGNFAFIDGQVQIVELWDTPDPPQDSGWGHLIGGIGGETGYCIANDSFGNIYIGGAFQVTVDFDPGPAIQNRTTNGSDDAYLLKLNPDGEYEWVLVWGGASGDSLKSIAVDNLGNIYAAGQIASLVDLNPGAGEDLHNPSGEDVYLTKFNSSGNFQWAVSWGGVSYDWTYDIAVSTNGYVYVAGLFNSDCDFDPGAGVDIQSVINADDCFLTCFNATGVHQWARVWGNTLFSPVYGYGLAPDSNNNIYIFGDFFDSCDFDPGPGNDVRVSNGDYDAFLSKFNQAGSRFWTRTWGGVFGDKGYDLAIDSSDNIYAVGGFVDSVDFNPGPGSEIHTSVGSIDCYLSCFDYNGVHQWAKTWGGTNYDYAHDIAVDNFNNLAISGSFASTDIDFDPGLGTDPRSTVGQLDIFLSKFNQSGIFHWARTWGGTGNDDISVLSTDPSGNIIITGYVQSVVDLDPGPSTYYESSNGGYDIPIIKVRYDGYW